ncbi:hypothetical protein T09_4308 [Trichinella sp. T9]|nr:hypothetical protein T09_4308 [Trichinella sp. T9]
MCAESHYCHQRHAARIKMVFSYDWIQIFQIPFNSFEAIIQFFLNCITVVALVHNYLTGVAIAESAELAEITNTMSDSYITFIDMFGIHMQLFT